MSGAKHDAKVEIMKNGPYVVSGNVPMSKQIIGTNKKGESETWEEGEKYPQEEKYAAVTRRASRFAMGRTRKCISTERKPPAALLTRCRRK